MKTHRKPKIKELLDFDNALRANNFLIGTDEAGRGPLAGPVVACAVHFETITPELEEAIKYLDDSKKFSGDSKLRKELSEEIKKHARYKIAECSAREIEKHNILQASLIAMRRACEELLKEMLPQNEPLILIDGRFKIKDMQALQMPVVKGDSKSASIAAASIIAKVERDEQMIAFAQEYPQYAWEKNKGYPTKAHIEAILKHGECDMHRKTFLNKIFQKKLF